VKVWPSGKKKNKKSEKRDGKGESTSFSSTEERTASESEKRKGVLPEERRRLGKLGREGND